MSSNNLRRPTISLVGRPNVGKSSLFNRLMRKADKAIAYNTPGVTRDRHYGVATFDDFEAILVDTGGFYPDAEGAPFACDNPHHKEFLRQQHVIPRQEDFLGLMTEQAFVAIDESDLVCLVVDVREGLSPFDIQLAQKIRQKGKAFWVLANKWDTPSQTGQESVFYKLSVDSEFLFPVSAAHGEGFPRLEEALSTLLKSFHKEEELNPTSVDWKDQGLVPETHKVWAKLAIVGAPNTGKSTLLNRLLKRDRALVSALPGTTMDPVTGYFDLYLGTEGEELKAQKIPEESEELGDRWVTLEIVDTAGIRRKSSIKAELESLSVFRSLRAMTDADIVLLMVDALKGISHHDRRMCEIALEKGKSLIILLNKVDLLKDLQRKPEDWREWLSAVQESLPWSYCRIVPVSAKTGQYLSGLKRALKETLLARNQKMNTGELNQQLEKLLLRKPLTLRTKHGGKVLKVRYATVVKMDPPTVLIFSNLTQEIPRDYRRYLINGLRDVFGLKNTPIHLVFRKE